MLGGLRSIGRLIFPYDFRRNKPSQLLNKNLLLKINLFLHKIHLMVLYMQVPQWHSQLGIGRSQAIYLLGCVFWVVICITVRTDQPTFMKGQPDPLRDDITLTSLRACSYRMLILAKCKVVT